MAGMPDRDSSPDASKPDEESRSEDPPKAGASSASKPPPSRSERPPPVKSERAPSKSVHPSPPKQRPPFPERLNTIDIIPGTLIGAHLPPLLEQEAKKRAAAAEGVAPQVAAPAPANAIEAPRVDMNENNNDRSWQSPLDTRPAWLIKLMSVPPRLWAIGVGGLLASFLLVSAVRGCAGKSRIDALEARVANLEKATGVNADAGAGATEEGSGAPGATTGAGSAVKLPSAAASADDPKKAKCALAKVTAYQAWQEAVDKAKALAGPAEAKCADFWTDSKKQACYGAALQNVHPAQVARDAVMKGGATARDAVKKVKDDPKNDAIEHARSASQAAFDTCQDENEL